MKARPVKKLNPQASLAENAARIVRVRLSELRSFAPEALDPGESGAQHDMRIAAKRLRYVLEATGFCFGRSGDRARKRARDLQDLLGELHDCDVMLPRVGGHVAELEASDAEAVRRRAGDAGDLEARFAARAPNRTSYRGLEVLAVYLRARRELLFDRFRDYWAEQERAGTWDRLDRAAERVREAAKERRKAAEHERHAREELERAERAEREAVDRARQATERIAEARRRGEAAGSSAP